MPVSLRTSAAISPSERQMPWFAPAEMEIAGQNPAHRVTDVAERLAAAFDGIRDEWWALGRRLAAAPTGWLSHAATCAPYGSDLGQCMAWCRVVCDLAGEAGRVLVICDDPWLFRALACLPGVDAGRPPALAAAAIRGRLRGLLARCRVALRVAWASIRHRRRCLAGTGGGHILVYGHPDSRPAHDAYFGDLLTRLPALRRVIHTDDFHVIDTLAADERSESLHGYGQPWYALACLPFARWRPSSDGLAPSTAWLVRRAAHVEGSGGAAAMTVWQAHCQRRWLASRRPAVVAWPWENHPWERMFIRDARAVGVRSFGYQHADAGPHQFNMSPHATARGLDDLPDTIVLNGPAYRRQFVDWGIPENRMAMGGAFRLPAPVGEKFDASGPVFVALSSFADVSAEMLEAVRMADDGHRRFLVKDHPMYPFDFDETACVQRTRTRFAQQAGCSAMFYGTGTSGIEGILAGVPTFRLLPSSRVGLETMPEGMRAEAIPAAGLGAALAAAESAGQRPSVDANDFFSPVDASFWIAHLSPPHSRDHA